MSGRVYSVIMEQVAQTAAKTLVQIVAGSNNGIEILRAWITMGDLDAADQSEAEILRKSAAATVTSFTPRRYNPDDALSKAIGGTALTGTDATVEGTDTDVIHSEGFNTLTGFLWVPSTMEDRIFVPGGGIIGLKLQRAITSAILTAGMVFKEN